MLTIVDVPDFTMHTLHNGYVATIRPNAVDDFLLTYVIWREQFDMWIEVTTTINHIDLRKCYHILAELEKEDYDNLRTG